MKNKTPIQLAILPAILLGMAISAQGAVLALYDFPTGQGTTLPSASTDSDPSTTASSLSLAPFGSPSNGFNLSGATSSGISSTSGDPVNSLFLRTTNNTTEANAVAFDKYFTFTISSASALDYASIDLSYNRQTAASATNFAIRTNAGGDNFSTDVAAGTMSGVSVWNNVSLDLSGAPLLQDVTGAVTFRVYVWGASGASSDTQIIRFDNIAVNATAVPEPSAGLFLMFAAAGLVVVRCFRGRREIR